MKNILILFMLLFSFGLSAQIINDNTDVNTSGNVSGQFLIWDGTNWVNNYPTIPGFPYTFEYEKDIEADGNITTINAFNGGVLSYDATTTSMRVGATGAGRGAEFQFTHTGSADYTAVIDIEDPSSGVRVYSQWATLITTLTTAGKHVVNYTADAAPGAFGAELILTPTIADTFFINSVTIYSRDADAVMYTPTQIDAFLSSKQDSIDAKITEDDYFNLSAGMYYNTFDETGDDTRLINATNATKTLDVANNALDITTTTIADRFYIGEQPIKRYSYQHLYLDIENVTDTLYLSVGEGSTDVFMLTADGIYERVFYFDKVISGVLSTNRAFITAGKSGVSYQINEFRQAQYPDIRKGLYADATIGTEAGFGADAGNSEGVAIGRDAIALQNTIYGGTGGPERTAVGETSRAMAWRATAIGGNSFAGNTSATAIGTGSVSLQTHGLALGRGGYVPSIGLVPFTVDFSYAENELFFNNGWGHQFNTPISGIGAGITPTPSAIEIKLHGQDAYDARYPIYDVGTTYASGDWVQRNDSVFISTTITTGNDPGLGEDWTYTYSTDAGGGPSDFNVDAGDFGIYAGQATGTGTSGSINLYVAEGNNGQNTKDTPKKALELRSDEAATTGTFLWLYNEATGTMQRVIIDTKPSVSGSNGIVGFSKGYRPE